MINELLSVCTSKDGNEPCLFDCALLKFNDDVRFIFFKNFLASLESALQQESSDTERRCSDSRCVSAIFCSALINLYSSISQSYPQLFVNVSSLTNKNLYLDILKPYFNDDRVYKRFNFAKMITDLFYSSLSRLVRTEDGGNEADFDLSQKQEVIRCLYALDIWSNFASCFILAVLQIMREYIAATTADNYENKLSAIFSWYNFLWLKISLLHAHVDAFMLEILKEENKLYLKNKLYKMYFNARSKQALGIVINYPDSKGALSDLKSLFAYSREANDCASLYHQTYSHHYEGIECADWPQQFCQTLIDELNQKIFKCSVNTSEILTLYISVINALYFLDYSMISSICELIRKHLKSRSDTVKCVVANITDEGLGKKFINEFISENRPARLECKQPLSRLAFCNQLQGTYDCDITTLLYGGLVKFVDEYQKHLAKRLLSRPDSDLNQLYKVLSFLKAKFGEHDLIKCDIMLKDAKDTQVINQKAREMAASDNLVSVFIFSAEFWPKLEASLDNEISSSNDICYPKHIERRIEKFIESYKKLKKKRTLLLKKALGCVELSVELPSPSGLIKVDFVVSPAQACVLLQFTKDTQRTLAEVSGNVGLSPSRVQACLLFWVCQNILIDLGKDVYSTFSGAARVPTTLFRNSVVFDESEESETAESSFKDLCKERELLVIWTYIKNILMNVGCLSLQTLFKTLQKFTKNINAIKDLTSNQLAEYLDSKVVEGLLQYNSGSYALSAQSKSSTEE